MGQRLLDRQRSPALGSSLGRVAIMIEEFSPGLWYWSARHPNHGQLVSSYYLANEGVLLDPMLPSDGVSFFESVSTPEHVLLTNRHHDRDAWKLREQFGCEVHCIANGCYELEGRGPVTPFEFGDELPGGVHAYEVDAICPDETALLIPAHRALACADGVVHWPGVDGLTFVSDDLMDDPPQTKRGLVQAYGSLLDLDFELLLLAHGTPERDGKRALREFTRANVGD
jgi:hypothetical protein